MNGDLFETLARVAIYFIPFLFSLCFHEFAHGWVALKRGDNTAQMMGRLTLNPNAHADMIGTYVLPLVSVVFQLPIFFGWAKPVPVNTRNLKNVRSDMFWIASAGPLSNILLAFIGAFVYVQFDPMISSGQGSLNKNIFIVFITMNLALAFFNLLPVHPLDGGKILARFLPPALDRKLEENQAIISMVLLVPFVGGFMRFMAYPILMTADLFINIAQKVLGA